MREFDFTSTPIVNIVNDIIIDAVNKNASDIHFDPHEKFLKIRVRVDGDLPRDELEQAVRRVFGRGQDDGGGDVPLRRGHRYRLHDYLGRPAQYAGQQLLGSAG